MNLITSNHPNFDFLNQDGVTGIFCSFTSNEIVIHLTCDEGREQIVFDGLPKWIHDEMKVTKSDQCVFLKAK